MKTAIGVVWRDWHLWLRNSNAFCNIARNGCADGEVVFRLPSGSFRLTYRKQQFTSSPGIWASVLRTYGGALGKYEHNGTTFDFVQLIREDYAPLPYSLDGFESMNRGINSEGFIHARKNASQSRRAYQKWHRA